MAIAVVVVVFAWAGFGPSDTTARVHRAVFGLDLADRYPLVTRRLDSDALRYVFWSPDEPAVTCRAITADPAMSPRPTAGAACAQAADVDPELSISVAVYDDPHRGGSLVEVVATPRE